MDNTSHVIKGDTGHRLLFLKEFMAAMNINATNAASILGCQRLTVSRWLTPTYDDAPLSSVMDLLSAFGYSLEIVLTRDFEKGVEEDVEWRRRNRAKFQADRLSFLTRMMLRYNITTKDLAAKMGLYYTTIDYMFRTNDVMMSRVYQIASICEMNIFINVKPKSEKFFPSKQYCTTTISVVCENTDFKTKQTKNKNTDKTTKNNDKEKHKADK